ncbi:MAG: hypothetical protein VCB43_08490, partial [Myxococcota bacterium]
TVMVLAATHDATGWATAKSLDHYTRCALLSERVVSGACLREIGMPGLGGMHRCRIARDKPRHCRLGVAGRGHGGSYASVQGQPRSC